MATCISSWLLEALWLPGRTRRRSALLLGMSCAFSNAELPRLNSFNCKLKELIQEEGRGGGKAQSCQVLSLDVSRRLKYFIRESLVNAKAFIPQGNPLNTEMLTLAQEFPMPQIPGWLPCALTLH